MVKGGFSDDSGNCGKPANARVSRGSGVLAAACRMDADTLPNHALCHLSYTRNCGIIITDMAGKSKGKIRGENFQPPGGLPRSGMVGYNGRKELNKGVSR